MPRAVWSAWGPNWRSRPPWAGGSPLGWAWRAPPVSRKDSRVFPLAFLPYGTDRARRDVRVWREVVELLTETNAQDWLVAGPRTPAWCARFLNRRSGGPLDWHRFWRSTLKLGEQDWGVGSHELGLCQLERAGCYDGLHTCDCGCLEDVFRWVQMVECAYLQSRQNDQGKAQFCFGISQGMSLFARTHRVSGNRMVYSDLLDFVNREVGKDAVITKQLRKREERRRDRRSKME